MIYTLIAVFVLSSGIQTQSVNELNKKLVFNPKTDMKIVKYSLKHKISLRNENKFPGSCKNNLIKYLCKNYSNKYH